MSEPHLDPDAGSLRERKKRQSRDAMHRAALELVSEHGLANVTVDHIAERAGVSPRTLFNYWGSKEAVVLGTDPGDDSALVDMLAARPLDEEPRESMRLILRENLHRSTPDRPIRTLKREVLRREPHLAQITSNSVNDVQRALINTLAERLTPAHGADEAYVAASLHVFWMAAMARSAYAVSMTRDIDLLDALDIILAQVDSGAVTL